MGHETPLNSMQCQFSEKRYISDKQSTFHVIITALILMLKSIDFFPFCAYFFLLIHQVWIVCYAIPQTVKPVILSGKVLISSDTEAFLSKLGERLPLMLLSVWDEQNRRILLICIDSY